MSNSLIFLTLLYLFESGDHTQMTCSCSSLQTSVTRQVTHAEVSSSLQPAEDLVQVTLLGSRTQVLSYHGTWEADMSSNTDQESNNLHVPAVDGTHQWGLIVPVLLVNQCSSLQQVLGHLQVSLRCGNMQWSSPVIIT